MSAAFEVYISDECFFTDPLLVYLIWSINLFSLRVPSESHMLRDISVPGHAVALATVLDLDVIDVALFTSQ